MWAREEEGAHLTTRWIGSCCRMRPSADSITTSPACVAPRVVCVRPTPTETLFR